MRKRGRLAQSATVAQIPSPVGGWNARDPLPEMAPTDAVILENLIPTASGVVLRGGQFTRTTGLGAPVNSLMRYNPPAGSPKAFATAGTSIFDVTASGPVGAAAVTGLTSDKFQSCNFGTPGGNFLICANGADTPRYFNGSTWATMTIANPTGYPYTLNPANLTAPFVFGNRLWFVEKNSLRVWYLPVYAISAPSGAPGAGTTAAQVIDFSSQVTLGGSLVAMADWTRDGGTGSDDYAVLITSAGQVLVYGGQDPNQTSFALVGIFRIPPPIGQRCVIRAGADLAVLTQTGVIPLSTALALTLSQIDTVAITDKIRNAFRLAYAGAPNTFGWELAEYPAGALLVVNAPQGGAPTQQYVMNTLTGAWCNFTGMDALTFGLLGDMLLFGTSAGTVVQYDVGFQDDGMPISAVMLPAFSSFKTPSAQKRFLNAKPLYAGAVGYRPAIKLAVDYDASRIALPQSSVPGAGTPWGSPWGSPWGPAIGQSSLWQDISGVAQVASVLMNVVSNNAFRFDHLDLTFETGGLF